MRSRGAAIFHRLIGGKTASCGRLRIGSVNVDFHGLTGMTQRAREGESSSRARWVFYRFFSSASQSTGFCLWIAYRRE